MSKITIEKTVEKRIAICDWCGEQAGPSTPQIYVRGNYAEPTVLPWWKQSLNNFVGIFLNDMWKENDYKYDVHVGCVEQIVEEAILAKRKNL